MSKSTSSKFVLTKYKRVAEVPPRKRHQSLQWAMVRSLYDRTLSRGHRKSAPHSAVFSGARLTAFPYKFCKPNSRVLTWPDNSTDNLVVYIITAAMAYIDEGQSSFNLKVSAKANIKRKNYILYNYFDASLYILYMTSAGVDNTIPKKKKRFFLLPYKVKHFVQFVNRYGICPIRLLRADKLTHKFWFFTMLPSFSAGKSCPSEHWPTS